MTSGTDRRAIFLAEIGVGPLWTRRDLPAAAEGPDGDSAVVHSAVVHSAIDGAALANPMNPMSDAASDMSMAFDAVTACGVVTDEPAYRAPARAAPATEIAKMDWAELKSTLSGCVKCDLCHGRTQTVFGVGDEKAKWLFVGEGPGYNEDLRGEPFVGQAGKLLDNMLLAMGLKRGENAYIANIVKCRPTDAGGRDRAPTSAEVASCMPYLQRQIALIKPAIIVALGKTAALSLLQLDPETPVSRLRGTVHQYADLPLVVTYHPAYLLRNLADKKKAWEDLSLAMTTYAAGS